MPYNIPPRLLPPALGILKDARQLLSDRNKWHRGYWSFDKYGEPCSPKSEEAVSWCALGALRHYGSPTGATFVYLAAEDALWQAAIQICPGASSIPEINDGKYNDAYDPYVKILEIYDLAIATAEKAIEERKES